MAKIVGFDLGTNSIGISVRDTDVASELKDQLIYYSSVIFKSGVGTEKGKEYSYAADRTSHRSARHMYRSRKRRIWSTLKLLIEHNCCPLSMDDLERWSTYDKARGLNRSYPVDAVAFEQWVRLDFNGDGKADYTSPYQLRAELMERPFDFTNLLDRYKLGRALYHIAQRRGFKSSKGETLAEQEKAETGAISQNEEADNLDTLKKSEDTKCKVLSAYMEENHLTTVGCAFAQLESEGVRLRNSEYQAVRAQYKDEINQIFEFQGIKDTESELYNRLMSERKGEGTIFYKLPLKSQKGNVGKCTLEPSKPRCSTSHPEFEKFRALSFINNIKYRNNKDVEWQSLSLDQKSRLYNDKFQRTSKNSFAFSEITQWLSKDIGHVLSYKEGTINYKDNVSVEGCPITGRLKDLLGIDWQSFELSADRNRTSKDGHTYTYKVSYGWQDIWNICFSFDEAEDVLNFSKDVLGFDEKHCKKMAQLWGVMQSNYASLSLKALHNINRFLEKGLMYTDSVLLAKLPELMKDQWDEYEAAITQELSKLIEQNRKRKQIYGIANGLIADYKSVDEEDGCESRRYNTDHLIDDDDMLAIEDKCKATYGANVWNKEFSEERRQTILDQVKILYQGFYSSSERAYYTLPKVSDELAAYIHSLLPELGSVERKLYHPSMISYYKPAVCRNEDGVFIKQLGSPVISAVKNPLVMRVLHILRGQVNQLIKKGIISPDDTRVVVELAREVNDTNMRWAIETYNKNREAENAEFEKIIKNYDSSISLNSKLVDKVRLLCDQYNPSEKEQEKAKKEQKENRKNREFSTDVKKYRLWLEQGCRCIYTGRIINIKSLLSGIDVDIEHTIPRSLSFDNSLANQTICDSHFNRTIKGQRIPSQLSNYEEILQRIQPWKDRVAEIRDNITYWKGQSKRAMYKGRKDRCIRQMHLWQLELDYWEKKVATFTTKDVTIGFKNAQLVDTRIISKYAYHYLKSVFDRVDVENGSVTAVFRKIFGIQGDGPKSRELHSHHAIDATVLTLVPVAAKRDRILELFYKKREGIITSDEAKELDRECHSCGRNASSIVDFIEKTILVNHVFHNQTLTPARRKWRIRGHVVPSKDDSSKPMRIMTGDCIRGQLHNESFYGAIKLPSCDADGNIRRDPNGHIIQKLNCDYVIRREFKYKASSADSGFEKWEDVEAAAVDKNLVKNLRSQFPENTTLKEAFALGIYMCDKNGNKVNRVRHIRCFAKPKEPILLKKQTYASNKDYKNSYYVTMAQGGYYCMSKYGEGKNSKFVLWSLFDVCDNRRINNEIVPSYLTTPKGERLEHIHDLKVGDTLLLYKDCKEEVEYLTSEQLSERMYQIGGFEKTASGGLVNLVKCVCASSVKEKGKSLKDKTLTELPMTLRNSVNNLPYLLQGVDFEIFNNKVTLIK